MAVLAAAGAGSAAADVKFVDATGTGAPPSLLGPYTVKPFAADTRPDSASVTNVIGPTGPLTFDEAMRHAVVGTSWASWSHGYRGSVYSSESNATPDKVTLTLPPSTRAFAFYAQPNGYQNFTLTATTDSGTRSTPVTVNGNAGARYNGFYAVGPGETLKSILLQTNTTLAGGFAVGEFSVANTSAPVTSSALPSVCGRRELSLVRADARGSKVKLQGLVGSRLYGKKVTIQTNYGSASKTGKLRTVATVRASSTGAFTATVKRPAAALSRAARFRAVAGSSKSAQLKLSQALASTSVKRSGNRITVKGKVSKSVLGKRQKVLIRRLVCGRYRTVGSARPSRSGAYSVRFPAATIDGVSFYRAEANVLVSPKSKRYVKQYARAISIRTTSQTG